MSAPPLQRKLAFVRRHLYRLRQVERRKLCAGRNRAAELTTLDVFIAQPIALGAEHERNVALASRELKACAVCSAALRTSTIGGPNCRSYPVIAYAVVTPASACASVRARFTRRQHIGATGRQRNRLRVLAIIGETRVHDHQPAKPHRLHRACGRSDIAGVTGGHKHEANAIKHRGEKRLDVDALNCTLSLIAARTSLSALPHAPDAQHGHQGRTQGRLDH